MSFFFRFSLQKKNSLTFFISLGKKRRHTFFQHFLRFIVFKIFGNPEIYSFSQVCTSIKMHEMKKSLQI